MADTIIKILIIAGLFFLAYKLIFSGSRGLTLFEMHFKDGKLNRHKGKIPEKFERDCRAIAKSNITIGCFGLIKNILFGFVKKGLIHILNYYIWLMIE